VAFQLWQDNRSLRGELDDAKDELSMFPAGLPVGAVAPSFSLPGAHGETITLESLCARGNPVLLIFAHPKCGPCWMMLPYVRRWQETLADRLTVAVVSSGTPESNQDVIDEQGIVDLILQEDHELMDRYRMEVTPSSVVVAPDGRIASTTVVGSRPVEPLVRLTLQGGDGAVGAKQTPAPRLAS
jgi:peroxiredoxin